MSFSREKFSWLLVAFKCKKKNEKSQHKNLREQSLKSAKHPKRLDSTFSSLGTRNSNVYLYLYTVVQQLFWKGSKKVDRTYIGSLVQTHLSWGATSQSQSSLRSKSELVLLLNRRSRWCMQRTMWTVLVSNTADESIRLYRKTREHAYV